jgi:hypothetical protein
MSLFMDDEDLVKFTGRKAKGKQIEALRQMGVAFFVNGTGHPVVARSVVDGNKQSAPAPEKPKWVPRVLQTG